MIAVAQLLAVCLAGGVGAALRFVVDGLVRQRSSGTYPLGTMIINITGSLALGLITGLLGSHLLPPLWQLVIGTGLLGGYTTFSTASVETVRLLQERRWWAATISGLGMLVLCVAAAAAGYGLGVAAG